MPAHHGHRKFQLSFLTVLLLGGVLGCGAVSPTPDEGAASPAVAPELAAGRELYLRHGCALCHGPEGRGDGPTSPTLDPPPRDLADPALYRQGSTAEDIANTLSTGVVVFRGSGMPPYPHLPPEERLALGRYIVSLQEVKE